MDISVGTFNDIEDIRSFIDNEWKKNHILSRDDEFFRFEYLYEKQVNFFLLKENDEIKGLIGFIPTSIKKGGQCYPENNSDICATLWKVTKDIATPAAGIQLLQALRDRENSGHLFCVGINEKTLGIYKFLGIYTDQLKHYAMINYDMDEFEIAKVSTFYNPIPTERNDSSNIRINKLVSEEGISKYNFEGQTKTIPIKNKAYLIKRYLNHPKYDYDIYGIYESDKLVSLFVTRIQAYNSARVIRIVDFFGEEKYIKPLGEFVAKLIRDERCEYADFYNFGLNMDILLESGFQLIDSDTEDLVVPTYFAPFLQKNITIYFFADFKEIDKLRIFKGDGDQDRPA